MIQQFFHQFIFEFVHTAALVFYKHIIELSKRISLNHIKWQIKSKKIKKRTPLKFVIIKVIKDMLEKWFLQYEIVRRLIILVKFGE